MKLGTDIIRINRIQNSLDKFGDKFLTKFLTKEEIIPAKRIESIAGIWAAKEAVSKALGCGISQELSFHDIIILKNDKGAPFFKLSPKAQALHHIKNTSLSISHDGGFAIAVVALEQF